MSSFDVIESEGRPIKAWARGVPIEEAALGQLRNVARLPFIHSHVAVMPDVFSRFRNTGQEPSSRQMLIMGHKQKCTADGA